MTNLIQQFVSLLDEMKISFDLGNIITGLIAIVSLIITLTQKHREIRSSTITNQRIDWIKRVRELCAEFLIEFNKDNPNLSKLEETEIRIKLYGRSNNAGLTKDYRDLFYALDICLSDVRNGEYTYKRQHMEQLLTASQDMLHSVWVQMKRESGISKRTDRKNEREHGLDRN